MTPISTLLDRIRDKYRLWSGAWRADQYTGHDLKVMHDALRVAVEALQTESEKTEKVTFGGFTEATPTMAARRAQQVLAEIQKILEGGEK